MTTKLIALLVVSAFFFSLTTVALAYDERTAKVQRSLRALGHYGGEITGEMDKDTTEAVKKFQKKCHLDPTGKPGKVTCERLWIEVTKELAPTAEDLKD